MPFCEEFDAVGDGDLGLKYCLTAYIVQVPSCLVFRCLGCSVSIIFQSLDAGYFVSDRIVAIEGKRLFRGWRPVNVVCQSSGFFSCH